MFKNALVFRIDRWDAPALTDTGERLAGAPFIPCGASQPESAGWVAPRGERHGALVESVGGHWLLRLCTETKSVPSGAVKAELQARLDAVEQETGRRPKGRRARELKEEIVHAMLPRAFPKRAETPVWLDPRSGFAWVGTANARRADAVVSRLVEALRGTLKLVAVQTALSPASAMAGWLADQEAPPGFSVDRDCELRQPDGEKATVRYARHGLDLAEIAEHIRAGKRPTRLALTWNGRVSFELTDALALKKIKLLDTALEGPAREAGADFDADAALVTGELSGLLADLVDALGGLQADAATEPAPAEPAHALAA
jgi:recombination associated protein RdgC